MKIQKRSIWASAIFVTILSLSAIAHPVYAGKAFNGSNVTGTNTSNSTGTNTSNNTGTNTSNNTGGNTSNNTGGNNTNQQGKTGYNTQVIAQIQELTARLRIAQASGNKAEINAVIAQTQEFLRSIQQPKGKHLQIDMVRSRQGW